MRVSRLTKEAREGKFMKYLYDDTRTLYDVFRRGVRESSEEGRGGGCGYLKEVYAIF